MIGRDRSKADELSGRESRQIAEEGPVKRGISWEWETTISNQVWLGRVSARCEFRSFEESTKKSADERVPVSVDERQRNGAATRHEGVCVNSDLVFARFVEKSCVILWIGLVVMWSPRTCSQLMRYEVYPGIVLLNRCDLSDSQNKKRLMLPSFREDVQNDCPSFPSSKVRKVHTPNPTTEQD
ncbi:hypothetical protein BLNAU_4878 [Blattamonas nauphoetae]|uniref:Uncharacterized protein n=1 Tax=Blattamonas nauphoetae TaxID=2049346 RepID=A0ABQ9Y8C7_9EUKA|nr:hypothetical protein BLNAU_4878 [Blattamonas nauphoetae]